MNPQDVHTLRVLIVEGGVIIKGVKIFSKSTREGVHQAGKIYGSAGAVQGVQKFVPPVQLKSERRLGLTDDHFIKYN